MELGWTIAPAVLLLALTVPTVSAIWDLGRAPAADALQVKVTGIQWRWQFEYPDIKDSEGKPLQVFDQLHIPVDKEIGAHLQSLDVIHSFWVPKLAGKLDVDARTRRTGCGSTPRSPAPTPASAPSSAAWAMPVCV